MIHRGPFPSVLPQSGVARLTLLGALALLSAGCTARDLRQAQEAYRIHDLGKAEENIREFVAEAGEGVDRVIAYLELGNVLRAQGNFQASNEAFQVADEAIEEIDEGPSVQLSKEGKALLTNLNALPYRGYNYDRVMLNTYRAINNLVLGDIDAARVELRRAYERQSEAVEENARRIEKLKEEAAEAAQGNAEENQPGYDVGRAIQDPQFQAGIAEQYGDLESYSAYSDYVNPFTEFLQALYFMHAAVDGDDTERARVSMKRVAGMAADNPYVKQDLSLAEIVASGEPSPPVTYVIFETGTAPKRGQIRIDIPLFIVNNSVDYVGANFPRLIMNDDYLAELTVEAAGQTYTTATLADMDSVVAQEFKNELPIVITRTLIGTGVKATIAYGIRKSIEEENPQPGETDWAGLAARIATASSPIAANQADPRTLATLPKQIQYARFATPEDGLVRIGGPGGQPIEVQIQPGETNVLLIRSINSTAPLQVSDFTLEEPSTWVADTSPSSP